MQSIYDFFHEYSKEEVIYVFNLLPDENKQLAIFIYGNDLNHLNKNNLKKVDYTFFYNRIIKKMRILLKKQRDGIKFRVNKCHKSIYLFFKNYSIDEIDYALATLNAKELNILNNSNSKYRDILIKINRILQVRRKNLNKNTKVILIEDKNNFLNQELSINYEIENPFILEELKRILLELKKDKYQDLLTMFTLKELVIFLLMKNINNYTINDITNLLKIDNQELVNITSYMLKMYNFSNLKIGDRENGKTTNNL